MMAPLERPNSGVELAADDLELLHRLDRHLDLAAAGAAAGGVAVGAPVDVQAAGRGGLPVGDDRVVAPRGRRQELDPRQQRDRGERAAVLQRHIQQLRAVEGAAHLGRGEVDQRGLTGDGDRLLEGAHAQDDVEGGRRTDPELVAGDLERGEARQGHRDREGPRQQLGREVAAVTAGDHLAERPVGLVLDEDGHPRQGTSRLVRDPSSKLGATLLCQGRRRRHADERGDGQECSKPSHCSTLLLTETNDRAVLSD